MPERRLVTFDDLGSIMPAVDGLLAGHETVGNWTLGQILDHLARTVNLTLVLPPADIPATRQQDLARRMFFRAPAFPDGQKVPPGVGEPEAGGDPREGAEALRAALARLAAHDGPFPPHPVLGPLTRAEWLLFHTRHAAHHLSFVVPT